MQANFKRGISLYIKNTWLLFVCILGIFGVGLSITVPPMLGLDEAAHFNRLYQISGGGMWSSTNGKSLGGSISSEIVNIQDEATSIRKNKSTLTWRRYNTETLKIPLNSSDQSFASYPGAAAYAPPAYGGGILGMLVSRILNLSFGMSTYVVRFSMLISFGAIVAYALYVLRSYKLRWLVFVVALWPQTVFQASVITADSLTTAVALLLLALYFKAFTERQLSKNEKLFLLIFALALPLIKFNYIFISLIAAFIPAKARAFNGLRNLKLPKYLYTILAITIIMSLAFGWLYITRGYADYIGPNRISVQPGLGSKTIDQVKYLLHHPFHIIVMLTSTLIHSGLNENWDHLARAVGKLGYNGVRTPSIVLITCWSLALLAAVYARSELLKLKKYNLIIAIGGILTAIGILMILYLTYSPIGNRLAEGFQGRYLIPVIPFILSGVAVCIPIDIKFTSRQAAMLVFAGLTIFSLVTSTFYYLGVTYSLIR